MTRRNGVYPQTFRKVSPPGVVPNKNLLVNQEVKTSMRKDLDQTDSCTDTSIGKGMTYFPLVWTVRSV